MIKNFLPIYGGKHYMLKHLLKYLAPHEKYVEVFGGTAKLLFAKDPSPIEVYNDIDGDFYNFFKVLQDDDLFEKFYKLCICTPYSREIFYECRESLKNEEDNVLRAWEFFVIARQCFSGRYKSPSWARCLTQSCRNMPLHVSAWISSIEKLQDVHARMMSVMVENIDFRNIIIDIDSSDTLFYLDPPYVKSSRKGNDKYRYDMEDLDHKDLVNILLNIKGKVILSGYRNDIYKELEDNGWSREEYSITSFAAGRTDDTGLNKKGAVLLNQQRLESIYTNYQWEKG